MGRSFFRQSRHLAAIWLVLPEFRCLFLWDNGCGHVVRKTSQPRSWEKEIIAGGLEEVRVQEHTNEVAKRTKGNVHASGNTLAETAGNHGEC
jgi:hypothetical protein